MIVGGTNMKKIIVRKPKRDYTKLNLTYNFIFQQVMKNKYLAKIFLEKLLKIKIKKIVYLFDEMTQSANISSKDTRYDILVVDEKNRIYDIEMENRKSKSLTLRASYYLDMLGVTAINSGDSYTEVPYRTVIFVTNFDPFGYDRCLYCGDVHRCKDISNLVLEDHRRDIYLNLHGHNGWKELAPEIQDFILLAKDTTRETAQKLKTKFGRKLFEQVELVRNDGDRRRKCMGMQSDYREDMRKSENRGMNRGINNTLKIQKMYKEGATKQDISKKTGVSVRSISKIVEVLE